MISLGYIDDVNLEGRVGEVASKVQAIVDASTKTGLSLNETKCEITANNMDIINNYPIFSHFKKVNKVDTLVLGAPVMAGEAVHRALREKKTALEQAISRLSLLPAHDALCLLKNSIAMPKLLYTLRSSPCSGSSVLTEFDNVLRTGLSRLLNVNLIDAQ